MEISYIVYMVLLGVNVVWALVNCFDKHKFIKANISYIFGIFASMLCITMCLLGIGNENLDIPRMVIIVIGQFNFTHFFQFSTYRVKIKGY
jgi:hypothetical protein